MNNINDRTWNWNGNQVADNESLDLILDEEHGRLFVESMLLLQNECRIDFERQIFHQINWTQNDHENAGHRVFICIVPLKASCECLRFMPNHSQETEIEFQRNDYHIGDDGFENGKLLFVQSVNASLFECFRLYHIGQFGWYFFRFFVDLNLEKTCQEKNRKKTWTRPCTNQWVMELLWQFFLSNCVVISIVIWHTKKSLNWTIYPRIFLHFVINNNEDKKIHLTHTQRHPITNSISDRGKIVQQFRCAWALTCRRDK